MTILALLFLVIGVGPLIVGLLRLAGNRGSVPPFHALLASALLCAFAFNLTFFIQELGLAMPKALVPGLHPILYHNDHDWTGHAPIAELLQGTGAIGTLTSGIVFLALLLTLSFSSATTRLLCFWMAFQGLFQSLCQLAIGTLLPGNDVGRALAYLHVPQAGKWALLLVAIGSMCVAGRMLAATYPRLSTPSPDPADRPSKRELLVPAVLAIPLIVPFRVPRNPVETVFIPLFVMTIGLGWLALGLAFRRGRDRVVRGVPTIVSPALMLLALLAIFQLVLRRGIPI